MWISDIPTPPFHPPSSLPACFYNRPVEHVAKDFVGKTLHVNTTQGIITETEAYGGYDDPASHAYKGITPRSSIMFDEAGYVYVYLIYGMYFCLNIVTGEKGIASAVLIRGLLLNDIFLKKIHLDGPGKLCRHLGITKKHQGLSVITSPLLYLTDNFVPFPYTIEQTPRIGIKRGLEKLWRFRMIF
jgi:DNA-3-methyladenine glycosylase